MSYARYVVMKKKGQWWIAFNGIEAGPYRTRQRASARGHETSVASRDAAGNEIIQWNVGDPVPAVSEASARPATTTLKIQGADYEMIVIIGALAISVAVTLFLLWGAH